LTDGNCASAAPPEARFRYCSALGLQWDAVARVRQVHGTRVLVFDEPWDGRPAEADGLAAARGTALGVAVADCVPVYLVDPVSGAGALVHAGREGTSGNIAGTGVRTLVERFAARPDRICALIGPSAGPCCYEVSDEMALAWECAGGTRRGRHLDLWDTNLRQLTAAGVAARQVEVSGICTICGGRFHSYRGGSGAARNLAVLAL